MTVSCKTLSRAFIHLFCAVSIALLRSIRLPWRRRRTVHVSIRPHRMHSVDVAYCYRTSGVVCVSLCVLVTTMSPAKTAEPIETPACGGTRVGCRVVIKNVHWSYLANMMNRTVRPRRWILLLPPDRGDIPAFTSAEAGTRLSDPEGMQGWVDLVGLLHTEMVYVPEEEEGHPSKY